MVSNRDAGVGNRAWAGPQSVGNEAKWLNDATFQVSPGEIAAD